MIILRVADIICEIFLKHFVRFLSSFDVKFQIIDIFFFVACLVKISGDDEPADDRDILQMIVEGLVRFFKLLSIFFAHGIHERANSSGGEHFRVSADEGFGEHADESGHCLWIDQMTQLEGCFVVNHKALRSLGEAVAFEDLILVRGEELSHVAALRLSFIEQF